jgi:hypothetical protein
MKGEKGQALSFTPVAVAFDALVITPFLGQAGSSMTGSRVYAEAIGMQYCGDEGVEHAIWRLAYDGLADNLISPGDKVTYSLDEAINGTIPGVTVVESDNSTCEITSVAGDETVSAVVAVSGSNITVSSWQIAW